MIVQAYYYDPCIRPNSLVADTNEGLFLLREGGIIPLTEKPHASHALKLKDRPAFFHKKGNGQPRQEHLAELKSAYSSKSDTVFLFENGAAIRLVHRNFCTHGFHDATGSTPELVPEFFSAAEAEKMRILEKDISASPFYRRVDGGSQPFAEPVEMAYVVYPGWLLPNEPHLFPQTSLLGDTSSVDFIMTYFDQKRNPAQVSQFWQIPSLFSSLTQASFDHGKWDIAPTKEDGFFPDHQVCEFSLNNRCIAELICVDTFCEPAYFPYHDTFTLTLHYLNTYEADVKGLIAQLLHRYDNIIPIPSHLCGRD